MMTGTLLLLYVFVVPLAKVMSKLEQNNKNILSYLIAKIFVDFKRRGYTCDNVFILNCR